MSKVPAGKRAPYVAFVFSSPQKESCWSLDFSQYLGAKLVLAGYSRIKLICYEKSSSPNAVNYDASKEEIKILAKVTGVNRTLTPDRRLIEYDNLASLPECSVIILCVDSKDTWECSKTVAKIMPKGADFCLISLQNGVKNFQSVEPAFSDRKGLPVLDGAVGCVVGRAAAGGALCNLNGGSLVLSRLKKDAADRGQKFINLLETCGLDVLYRAHVTPHTWGILVYNLFQAVCALTGLPPAAVFWDGRLRLVYAQCLGECLQALKKAAAGSPGNWAPDGWAVLGFWVSLSAFERLLALPAPLWAPLHPFLAPAAGGAPCAANRDFREGRGTHAAAALRELVAVVEKHRGRAPVTVGLLLALEEALAAAPPGHPRRGGPGAGGAPFAPAALYRRLGRPAASRRRLAAALFWWGGLAALVCGAAYLLN